MYVRIAVFVTMAFLYSEVLGSAPAPGMMLMMMLPYQQQIGLQQLKTAQENAVVMDEGMVASMASNMESIEKEMAKTTFEKRMEMKGNSKMKNTAAATSTSMINGAMMQHLMEKISGMIKEMKETNSAGKASPEMMLGAAMQEVETAVKMEMTGGCQKLGMFLPVPGDKCHFVQCTYGEEPWVSAGVARIVPTQMQCPPGLAVGASYKGGYDLPCTEKTNGCALKEVASVHKPAARRTSQRATKYD